jgi:hypothetical protein
MKRYIVKKYWSVLSEADDLFDESSKLRTSMKEGSAEEKRYHEVGERLKNWQRKYNTYLAMFNFFNKKWKLTAKEFQELLK